MHIQMGGNFAVDRLQELVELDRAVTLVQAPDHLAPRQVQRGVEAGGPVALIVMRRALGRAGSIGRTGRVRSNAWIWLFSSTHRTTARSGGFRYSPQMS